MKSFSGLTYSTLTYRHHSGSWLPRIPTIWPKDSADNAEATYFTRNCNPIRQVASSLPTFCSALFRISRVLDGSRPQKKRLDPPRTTTPFTDSCVGARESVNWANPRLDQPFIHVVQSRRLFERSTNGNKGTLLPLILIPSSRSNQPPRQVWPAWTRLSTKRRPTKEDGPARPALLLFLPLFLLLIRRISSKPTKGRHKILSVRSTSPPSQWLLLSS